jgi:NADPH2:quinone reductase
VKAGAYRRTGPAREVLEIVELDDPNPGPGEVRVRMRRAGVNPTDVKSRAGYRGRPMAFPMQVPGQDGAGVVDAIGEGVERARLGERVWLFHTALGRPLGSAAELAVVPEWQAVPLPNGTSDDQAAGLGIPFMTAHRCLLADGPVDGATILVAGGAGAVGNAAIQLARRAGARAIATASNEAKSELARQAGAELVVDYTAPGAADTIREFAPDGVNRIVEVALGTNLELDLAVAAHAAKIVTYSPDPSPVELSLMPLIARDVELMFMLIYSAPEAALREAAECISDALRDDALRPLPTRRFQLDDVVAAHEAVEAGTVGKVVLEID